MATIFPVLRPCLVGQVDLGSQGGCLSRFRRFWCFCIRRHWRAFKILSWLVLNSEHWTTLNSLNIEQHWTVLMSNVGRTRLNHPYILPELLWVGKSTGNHRTSCTQLLGRNSHGLNLAELWKCYQWFNGYHSILWVYYGYLDNLSKYWFVWKWGALNHRSILVDPLNHENYLYLSCKLQLSRISDILRAYLS